MFLNVLIFVFVVIGTSANYGDVDYQEISENIWDDPSTPLNSNNTNHETVCSDFVNILLDHVLDRLKYSVEDPYKLDDIKSTFVTIKQPIVSGIRNIRRHGTVLMQQQEIWQRRGAETESHRKGTTDNVTLSDWMRKRDLKVGNRLQLTFWLSIPSNISLQGEIYIAWYSPQPLVITISNIKVRFELSLYLNTTGRMGVVLNKIEIEKLQHIGVQMYEDEKEVDSIEEWLAELNQSEQLSSDKSELEWYLNGPLYNILINSIESMMEDSLSAMIAQQQGL